MAKEEKQKKLNLNGKYGARPGAGRKHGSKSRSTIEKERYGIEAVKLAREIGATPLEVILDNMHFAYDVAIKKQAKMFERLIELGESINDDNDARQEASAMLHDVLMLRNTANRFAVDAAPYVHPRLTSVAVKPEHEDPLALMNKILGELDGTTRGLPAGASGSFEGSVYPGRSVVATEQLVHHREQTRPDRPLPAE